MSRRVAHVSRGTLGDREVRLSVHEASAAGAFRHCRNGATRPTWDPRRGVWRVPASSWSCVRRLLTAEGFEINEAAVPASPAMRRFAAAQARAQRARDNERWIHGVESTAVVKTASTDETSDVVPLAEVDAVSS